MSDIFDEVDSRLRRRRSLWRAALPLIVLVLLFAGALLFGVSRQQSFSRRCHEAGGTPSALGRRPVYLSRSVAIPMDGR